VDRVEIPKIEQEAEEGAANKAAGPVAALSAAPAPAVGADEGSISAFLSSLVAAAGKTGGAAAAARVKASAEGLEDCVQGRAESRDLIAERLSLLKASAGEGEEEGKGRGGGGRGG
jgi:hypothetical protein